MACLGSIFNIRSGLSENTTRNGMASLTQERRYESHLD